MEGQNGKRPATMEAPAAPQMAQVPEGAIGVSMQQALEEAFKAIGELTVQVRVMGAELQLRDEIIQAYQAQLTPPDAPAAPGDAAAEDATAT